MKYIQKRNNTYYYRRVIPTSLSGSTNVKEIHRSLSTDKQSAFRLSKYYDSLFTMIDLSIKLKQDITKLVEDLDLPNEEKKKCIYRMYVDHQDVSDNRRAKIERLLTTIQHLLPKNLDKVSMTQLDNIKQSLSTMPRRNIQKYKVIPLTKLVKMKVAEEDRMSGETVNDHLKTLNSLIKFAYERDYVAKPYSVNMIKKSTDSRSERVALSIDVIKHAVADAKTTKLGTSFTLLYLSGLRPSEAFKCKITEIDGIKCFDLTDKSLQLKSKSSYRFIPVHKSIDDPEQLLEDLQTMSPQYLNRQFKVAEGTLYSLRHSFATELAAKGVEPHLISELLGHTHHDMTMGRYVKGFPVQMLKNAVDNL